MPIPGARYRFKRLKGGKAVRLAFKGNKVVEATPFKSKGGTLKKAGESKMVGLAKKVFR